jgi:hypothetical protein
MDMAAWVPAHQLTKPHWITAQRLPRVQLPIPGWPGWYIGAWPSGPVPLPPDVEIDKGPAWQH